MHNGPTPNARATHFSRHSGSISIEPGPPTPPWRAFSASGRASHASGRHSHTPGSLGGGTPVAGAVVLLRLAPPISTAWTHTPAPSCRGTQRTSRFGHARRLAPITHQVHSEHRRLGFFSKPAAGATLPYPSNAPARGGAGTLRRQGQRRIPFTMALQPVAAVWQRPRNVTELRMVSSTAW